MTVIKPGAVLDQGVFNPDDGWLAYRTDVGLPGSQYR